MSLRIDRCLSKINTSIAATSFALIAAACAQQAQPDTPAQPPPLAEQSARHEAPSALNQPNAGQPSAPPPAEHGGFSQPGASAQADPSLQPGASAPDDGTAAGAPQPLQGSQPSDPAARNPGTTGAVGATDSPPETALNDQTIEAFARAYIQIAQLQQEYQQAVSQATERTQIEEAQAETSRQVLSVIEEEEDLTLEQFQQIQLSVERDPSLRERVEASVRELSQ